MGTPTDKSIWESKLNGKIDRFVIKGGGKAISEKKQHINKEIDINQRLSTIETSIEELKEMINKLHYDLRRITQISRNISNQGNN